jgi:amino acid transporter
VVALGRLALPLETFGVLAGAVLAVAAVTTRFRRSARLERQQVKWLLWAVVLIGLTLPASMVDGNGDSGFTILDAVAVGCLSLLPISVGIAVLRYRLYEIDRIVSRTLAWALVTGILVAVFAGLVVSLQAVLAPVTNENTLAVAASTLVAFALFQPLRRRVQRAVDRRFDRARYDGELTVTAFGSRLRDQGELSAIRVDVLATVDVVVRPSSKGLWLRGPGTGAAL